MVQPRACECWSGDTAACLGSTMTHLTLNKSSRDEIVSLSLDFLLSAPSRLGPGAVPSSAFT